MLADHAQPARAASLAASPPEDGAKLIHQLDWWPRPNRDDDYGRTAFFRDAGLISQSAREVARSTDMDVAMNKQLKFVVLGSLIFLAGLVWLVARSQRNATSASVAIVPTPLAQATDAVEKIDPAPVLVAPAAAQPVVRQIEQVPIPDATRHVAQPGETVNSMASDLLGKNTEQNRDAIINANPSLKADPDKVLAGKTYHIPSAAEASATPAVTAVVVDPPTPVAAPAVKDVVVSSPPKEMKYTATAGDTVSNLAGAFLGNDSQKNQDKIINANPSLQADPDHVVAGKTYRIPTPNGLSVSADASESKKAVSHATTQPDEDQVIAAGAPRTLRYTARAGDTVSTLAIQLLGSDTPEARDAIINNNPTLKSNPDRLIAGQTYWIPAPTPVAANQ
jgi:hypothetical protein